MMPSKTVRYGLLLLMIGTGALALSGDTPTAGSMRLTPLTHRHGPIKIHQRRSESAWESYNWSGYAVTGTAGSVTDVKGSWIVPSVTCPSGSKPKQNQNQYSSFWVGIDGFSDNTVEQIGTDSDCQSGNPTYYAWFEFYPNPMYPINSLAIHPGDVISAEVTANGGGVFTVTLTNVSEPAPGNSFSTTTTVGNAQQSSAEWIAEAPSSLSGVLPLANFGTVDFGYNYTAVASTSDATVGSTTGAIGAFGANIQEITMVSKRPPHVVKAQPSPVSSNGTSFFDQWESAGP